MDFPMSDLQYNLELFSCRCVSRDLLFATSITKLCTFNILVLGNP